MLRFLPLLVAALVAPPVAAATIEVTRAYAGPLFADACDPAVGLPGDACVEIPPGATWLRIWGDDATRRSPVFDVRTVDANGAGTLSFHACAPTYYPIPPGQALVHVRLSAESETCWVNGKVAGPPTAGTFTFRFW